MYICPQQNKYKGPNIPLFLILKISFKSSYLIKNLQLELNKNYLVLKLVLTFCYSPSILTLKSVFFFKDDFKLKRFIINEVLVGDNH